jgi:hypothetical protein
MSAFELDVQALGHDVVMVLMVRNENNNVATELFHRMKQRRNLASTLCYN